MAGLTITWKREDRGVPGRKCRCLSLLQGPRGSHWRTEPDCLQCMAQHKLDSKLTPLWQERMFFPLVTGETHFCQAEIIHLSSVAYIPANTASLQGKHDCIVHHSHMLSRNTSIFPGNHDAQKRSLYCCLVQSSSSSSQKADWKGEWKRMVPDTGLLPSVYSDVIYSSGLQVPHTGYIKKKKQKKETLWERNL